MEQLLTPREAADYLGVTEGALAQWRYLGRGPRSTKLHSRAVRYAASDLEEWVESRRNDRGH